VSTTPDGPLNTATNPVALCHADQQMHMMAEWISRLEEEGKALKEAM